MQEITQSPLIARKGIVSPETSSYQSQPKATLQIKPWVGILVALSVLSLIYSSQTECKLVGSTVGFQESKEKPSETLSPTRKALHPIDRSWCPNAQCMNSPVCEPCQRRFLIVITNGRSASTTLTWMLNLLPGVRMGGENNNAIQRIMNMIKGVTDPPFRLKPLASTKFSAWDHNPIPDGSLACVAQKMIETIVPPAIINGTKLHPNEGEEIVGFKTIRLMRDNKLSDVPTIAAFLVNYFPCARFIINYRSDFVGQAQSQVTAFVSYKEGKTEADAVVEKIAKEVERLKKLAELLGKRAKIIDSAKWTEDVGELNKVVKWLGFDDTCAFPKLMELNTGGNSTNTRNLGTVPNQGRGRMNGPSPSRANKLGPRGASGNYPKKSTVWFANKKKAKSTGLPKAYQHSETNVELDPRCRYVGR